MLMDILFLTTCYPHPTAPVRGTYNYELCEALRNVARVRIVSPRPWTEIVRNWRSKPAQPERGSLRTAYPCFLFPPKVLRHQYGQFMWKSIRKQVKETSEGLSADWVLSYWAHPDGEAGLEAARACGAKAGVIVGGSDVLILTKDPKRRKGVQRVLTESDAVFTVSEGLRRHVISLGTDEAKVHTIYQGTNPAKFSGGFKSLARQRLSIPTPDRVFLWVGRLVDVKRPSLLIEAFALVKQAEPAARLILAGDGPLLAETQGLVRQAGLGESVHFAGAVPQSELPLWYRAADATVLSSDSEGLPNVFRESLACGTPFVSTDVGSISEIASPAYSLLARQGDAGDLSRAMLEILNVRFQLGVQQYQPRTWADCASDMTDVMANVTSSSTFRQEAPPRDEVGAEALADDLMAANEGRPVSVFREGATHVTHNS